jgi:hypothetical protein
MTIKTEVIVKDAPKNNGKFVYLKNVPVYFASILSTKKKYQSEDRAYEMTVFVDSESREKLELPFDEGGAAINKELKEVGKDRNKKKRIKYPVKSQLKDGEGFSYDDVAGLHGMSLSLDEYSKKGNKNTLKVVDSEGNDWPKDKLVGNGSVCHIKLWGYVNQDEQLVVYPNLVVVVDHVPYEGSGNGGVVEDDVLGITVDMTSGKDPEPELPGEDMGEEPVFEEDDIY